MALNSLLSFIAQDLRLKESYIDKIAQRSNKYYREYWIKKTNGGLRKICHPSPELKTLQYWIINNILFWLPISDFAFAYRKGISIKDHALKHETSNFTLHIDIKNFFESITDRHLELVIRQNASHPRIAAFFNDTIDNNTLYNNLQFIKQICLKVGRVSIGAVSSPVISNVIMHEFDLWANAYAQANNLIYTRYADDIYISSTAFIAMSVRDAFKDQLEKYGFQLNASKTRFMSRKNRRKITGLVITSDRQIGVGVKLRNNIKSMIYNKITKDIGDADCILGYLAFLQQIEPMTYNKIIIKYSGYDDVVSKIKASSS